MDKAASQRIAATLYGVLLDPDAWNMHALEKDQDFWGLRIHDDGTTLTFCTDGVTIVSLTVSAWELHNIFPPIRPDVREGQD